MGIISNISYIVLPVLVAYWLYGKIQAWDGKCPFHLFLMDQCPPPKLEGSFDDVPHVLFTSEQLALHNGTDEESSLWLAILGEVFDVSQGPQYYGKGGGYEGFVGRDGSRAFVLGGFTDKELVPDCLDLKPEQIGGIWHWVNFYRDSKIYHAKGKLIGYWYDKNGNPTDKLATFCEMLEVAEEEKQKKQELSKQFPRCNARSGSKVKKKVWCTQRSGGVKREIPGFPRLFKETPSSKARCACVQANMLDDARLTMYEGCDAESLECWLDKEPPKVKSNIPEGPKPT